MTRFRPCIDLHEGKVKQIVGGSLSDHLDTLKTNFISEKEPAWYATQYRQDGLMGGHVIALGKGNTDAAKSALQAFPQGLQYGGGVDFENAQEWLEAGAASVIVTSWIFPELELDWQRLKELSYKIGSDNLVVDLSCRKNSDGSWCVAKNRWQTRTHVSITKNILNEISQYCHEFLIHAADVEGLCQGIDRELVQFLGRESPIPVTYAGGASNLNDLQLVKELGKGRVDLTIGSALDLFGGTGIRYQDCIAWNANQKVRT